MGNQNISPQTKNHVLVVDDDQEQLSFLKLLLENGGYSVTEACGALCGLHCAEKQRFDALVTDLIMPDMNGAELVAQIRKTQSNAKIAAVLLTAGSNAIATGNLDLHSTQFRANAFCLKKDVKRLLVDQLQTLLMGNRTLPQIDF